MSTCMRTAVELRARDGVHGAQVRLPLAISRNQSQSVAISRNQAQSGAISRNQSQSGAIRHAPRYLISSPSSCARRATSEM